MNNSLSNTFKIMLLLEKYDQNCQVVCAATGMNGLKRPNSFDHIFLTLTIPEGEMWI